jgi:hypothetical protein
LEVFSVAVPFDKTYFELVESICAGTYYNPEKIIIELDVSAKHMTKL